MHALCVFFCVCFCACVFLCMHTLGRANVRACFCACIPLCMHTFLHAYVCACVILCVHTFARACFCACVRACACFVQAFVGTFIRVRACVRMFRMCLCACLHASMCACACTLHACTRTGPSFFSLSTFRETFFDVRLSCVNSTELSMISHNARSTLYLQLPK